jgi:hypothetical protein
LLFGRAIIDRVNALRLSRALVFASALVGPSLLVSACGGTPASHVAQLGSTAAAKQGSSSSTTAAGSGQQTALATALAFSQCMRSHGVPGFPDPDSQGRFPPQSSLSAQAKETSLSAQNACKRLLPSGGVGTAADRQAKSAFALKVARCLRANGFPNFPDPTVSGRTTSENLSGAGIDPNAPRFQAAETACEDQARKALGLP